MGGGGFTPLLVSPLTSTSAGRGAAAPLVLLIWCVAESGLLLPSRPREVVSWALFETIVLVLRSVGGVLDVVVSPVLVALGRKPCLTPPVRPVSVLRQNGLTPTTHTPVPCLSDGHALLALLPGAPLLPSACLCVPLMKDGGVRGGGRRASRRISPRSVSALGGCGARPIEGTARSGSACCVWFVAKGGCGGRR